MDHQPVQINHALVLFSGGQDSTLCLAWALSRFTKVSTLGFSYGQRHIIELECRQNVLREVCAYNSAWSERLQFDKLISIPELGDVTQSALTNQEAPIFADKSGLPTSFVPARNLIFLNLAAAYAYDLNICHFVGGMCETDYSGYPDCRIQTLDAQMHALSLGLDRALVLHTPLMYRSKAESWAMAAQIGGSDFVHLIEEYSHSCYQGDRKHRHPWGYGCNQCPACHLRARGWYEWQAQKYQAINA